MIWRNLSKENLVSPLAIHMLRIKMQYNNNPQQQDLGFRKFPTP